MRPSAAPRNLSHCADELSPRRAERTLDQDWFKYKMGRSLANCTLAIWWDLCFFRVSYWPAGLQHLVLPSDYIVSSTGHRAMDSSLSHLPARRGSWGIVHQSNTQVFGCRWYRYIDMYIYIYSRRSCRLSSRRYLTQSVSLSLSRSVRPVCVWVLCNPVGSTCRMDNLDWGEAQAVELSCLAIENSWLRLHFKGRTAHDTWSKSAWANCRCWATALSRKKTYLLN